MGTVDEVIRVIYFAHTARELWKSETLWKKLYEITTTAQCLIVNFLVLDISINKRNYIYINQM